MAEELSTAFGGGEAAAAPLVETVKDAHATIDTAPPVAEAKPWEGHADLKDFADSDGSLNQEKVAKVLADRRSHITRQDEVIKSLREATGQEAPGAVDDYLTGFDHEGLKAKAPKAYFGAGEDGKNVSASAFFNAMFEAGVPVEKARAAFGTFMGGLNDVLPEQPTKAQRLEAAVTQLGPNGRQQLQDVNAWVGSMHAKLQFNEHERRLLDEVMHTGAGLSALWRMSRAMGSTAPPDATSLTQDVMGLEEIHEAMRSDRYKSDDEYRTRIMKAYGALNGSGDTTTSRTLRLGA